VEEDENLGTHARLNSSAKRERVVLATFFFLFLCDLRFIIVRKARKEMEQTRDREGENASCVKQASRLMRTNVLLNRVNQHQKHRERQTRKRRREKKSRYKKKED